MFHRWHPQLALRYLPIVKYIKNSGLKNPTILEVGSGSLGIGPYLNQPFTGVDIDFSGPQWPQMRKIRASADKLPFADNSFDIVISVDTLEHIPSHLRQRVTTELLRVTKSDLIIAVPIGQKSAQQDRQLYKEYKQKYDKPFEFLTEHVKYGLPEVEEVKDWIKSSAKNVKITQIGNRNLSLRLWLMRGWMTKNHLIDFFFRKVLLLFIPILQLIDKNPPHYRQIFFINVD